MTDGETHIERAANILGNSKTAKNDKDGKGKAFKASRYQEVKTAANSASTQHCCEAGTHP